MGELAIRFCIGGLVVSAFSLLSDLLKPKTFAGLFGAAPSIALASLGLTIYSDGYHTASIEARSMVLGAVALFIYASGTSYLVLRYKFPARIVSLAMLFVWLGAATALWYVLLAV